MILVEEIIGAAYSSAVIIDDMYAKQRYVDCQPRSKSQFPLKI